jgi:hypothetical protein
VGGDNHFVRRSDNHLGRYRRRRVGRVLRWLIASQSGQSMSGTRITDQQVRLYMSKRKDHTQEIAAAKAGISVRSARRIERDSQLPSQKPRRYWRSKPDSFAEVWDTEVVPMLVSEPRL